MKQEHTLSARPTWRKGRGLYGRFYLSWYRRCRLFYRTRTWYQRKAHCAEVRSVATAPPRLLGPRFRKGNPLSCADLSHRFPGESRDPGTPEPWVTARRAMNHHHLHQPEGAVLCKSPRASFQRKAHCAEVRSVATAPPRPLGPRFRKGNPLYMCRSLSSFSRRKPGSRDHRALGSGQKGIDPPRPPQHGGCCSFKKPLASFQHRKNFAEVHTVATAPPRPLRHRFRKGKPLYMYRY